MTQSMGQSAPPPISICILTFNRCPLLREMLQELTVLQYAPLEIIVVDNHSEDETPRALPAEFPAVRYIRTDKNIGASARNIGMRAATGEIVVTLDDDIRHLTDSALTFLGDYFRVNPDVGALNLGVRNDDGEVCNWVHHCKQDECFDKEFLTYEITEGAVAFRNEAIRRSGGYPDTFFLSHEGPDLAFRIFEAGYAVKYSGGVVVTHLFADEGRAPWRNYYFDTRNQLWLAARNFPFWYAIAYLGRGLTSMGFYSLRDGYLRYWLKALRDGFAGMRTALRERRVLSAATMAIVKDIDSARPDLVYMVKMRMFSKRSVNLK